jgi:hypothetical protein
MRARWIDAVAFMEMADAPLFEHVLERTLSGLDVTYYYYPCDVLGVELSTDVDEVLFRLSLLNEGTIDGIQRIEPRQYLVSPRLTDDVHRFIAQRTFEGVTTTLRMASLELRGEALLDRLEAALAAERPAFRERWFPTPYRC